MEMDSTNQAKEARQAASAWRGVCPRNLLGVAIAVLVLGLLIWAKLQLVVGVPRTAVATPEDDQNVRAPHEHVSGASDR